MCSQPTRRSCSHTRLWVRKYVSRTARRYWLIVFREIWHCVIGWALWCPLQTHINCVGIGCTTVLLHYGSLEIAPSRTNQHPWMNRRSYLFSWNKACCVECRAYLAKSRLLEEAVPDSWRCDRFPGKIFRKRLRFFFTFSELLTAKPTIIGTQTVNDGHKAILGDLNRNKTMWVLATWRYWARTSRKKHS